MHTSFAWKLYYLGKRIKEKANNMYNKYDGTWMNYTKLYDIDSLIETYIKIISICSTFISTPLCNCSLSNRIILPSLTYKKCIDEHNITTCGSIIHIVIFLWLYLQANMPITNMYAVFPCKSLCLGILLSPNHIEVW